MLCGWVGMERGGGGRHQMRHPTKQGRIGIFATVKKITGINTIRNCSQWCPSGIVFVACASRLAQREYGGAIRGGWLAMMASPASKERIVRDRNWGGN